MSITEKFERKPQEISYTVEAIRNIDNKKVEDLARSLIEEDYWLHSDAQDLFELRLCNIYIQAQNMSLKHNKKKNIFAVGF